MLIFKQNIHYGCNQIYFILRDFQTTQYKMIVKKNSLVNKLKKLVVVMENSPSVQELYSNKSILKVFTYGRPLGLLGVTRTRRPPTHYPNPYPEFQGKRLCDKNRTLETNILNVIQIFEDKFPCKKCARIILLERQADNQLPIDFPIVDKDFFKWKPNSVIR